MSSVTPIEDKKPRTAMDAYNELTLKLGYLKSITVLIRAADAERIETEDWENVGYALENMVEDIEERARELSELGGVS